MTIATIERPFDAAAGMGGMPHAAQPHIRALDGLRGLAALMVLLSHMVGWGVPVDRNLGAYGVMLFFVLSGFLMGHLYLQRAFEPGALAEYVIARISRILPLYLLVVIAGHTLGLVLPDFPYAMGPVDLIRHLAFVGSYPIFWSIGPEFQFYFLFPILWWAARQAPEPRRNALAVIAAVAIPIVLMRAEFPGFTVLSKLPIFLVGIGLAVIRSHMGAPGHSRGVVWMQIAAIGILAAIVMPAIGQDTLYPPHGDLKLGQYYQDFGKILAMALCVYAFSFDHGPGRVILGNRPMRMLGRVSFSLYLLHEPVLYFVNWAAPADGGARTGVILLAITTSCVIAGISFRLYEEPARKAARFHLNRLFSGIEYGKKV